MTKTNTQRSNTPAAVEVATPTATAQLHIMPGVDLQTLYKQHMSHVYSESIIAAYRADEACGQAGYWAPCAGYAVITAGQVAAITCGFDSKLNVDKAIAEVWTRAEADKIAHDTIVHELALVCVARGNAMLIAKGSSETLLLVNGKTQRPGAVTGLYAIRAQVATSAGGQKTTSSNAAQEFFRRVLLAHADTPKAAKVPSSLSKAERIARMLAKLSDEEVSEAFNLAGKYRAVVASGKAK